VSDCDITDGSLEDASFVGVEAGTATVTVDWNGATSSLQIQVVDDATIVESVSITSPKSSVRAIQNASVSMTVLTTFDDGTSISDVSALTDVSYSDYLSFDASDRRVLGVSSDGTLFPRLNTAGSFTESIVVSSSIDASTSTDAAYTVNLKPDLYDIDLGKKTGSQFPVKSIGDTFEV